MDGPARRGPSAIWRSLISSILPDSTNQDKGAYELVDRDTNHTTFTGSSNSHISQSSSSTPTAHDLATLRKVSDNIPHAAFLVAAIEFCERFTYYGLSGPFQNYISNPPSSSATDLPGAIGLGQSGATALTNFFQFWCYVTPFVGAIVADQYLGKYKTIFYFSIVYVIGVLILFLTSLPPAIDRGYALPGLVTAMVVIGLGTGGIKANVSPLIAEQYTNTEPLVRTLPSGQRVLVDPAVTLSRIYMLFYLCINFGSLASLATTLLEKNVGYWAAYLLPLFMFFVGFWVLVAGRRHYVMRPPTGSVIPTAARVLWIGLLHNGNLDAAKPGYQALHGYRNVITWDNDFVDELKRALVACKVFVFYPIYWVCFNQMLNNFVSQAGQMQLHGIPNDMVQNADPLTIILFIPFCDRLFYPALRRIGVQFKPITRIFWGFMLGAAAMAYAAYVQRTIYKAAPCYNAPRNCEAGKLSDGTYMPNQVHVAIQVPAYLLIGMSEIFAVVTGLEYAFAKAPASLKSIVMSLFLFTNAIGAALAMLLSPVAKDPQLVLMYAGLAVACFVAGVLFWLIYSPYNKLESGSGRDGIAQTKDADPHIEE